MNAFIKYLGKRIAAEQKIKIVDEEAYLKRVDSALAALVGARIFIADATARGIVEEVSEDENSTI